MNRRPQQQSQHMEWLLVHVPVVTRHLWARLSLAMLHSRRGQRHPETAICRASAASNKHAKHGHETTANRHALLTVLAAIVQRGCARLRTSPRRLPRLPQRCCQLLLVLRLPRPPTPSLRCRRALKAGERGGRRGYLSSVDYESRRCGGRFEPARWWSAPSHASNVHERHACCLSICVRVSTECVSLTLTMSRRPVPK